MPPSMSSTSPLRSLSATLCLGMLDILRDSGSPSRAFEQETSYASPAAGHDARRRRLPSRLIPSVPTTMASPGNVAIHHDVVR